MIEMKFFRGLDDGSVHLEFRGHAGTAPKGEDLLCAAATMVAYPAAQAVQFLQEQGKLRCSPKLQLEDGFASIVAHPKKDAEAETLLVFWVAQAGAYVLRCNYPQNVSLLPMGPQA